MNTLRFFEFFCDTFSCLQTVKYLQLLQSVMDLEQGSLMIIFGSLLKQASFLEAAGAVAEIVTSLKPNKMTKFSLFKSVKCSVENVMSFISLAYWLFLLKLSRRQIKLSPNLNFVSFYFGCIFLANGLAPFRAHLNSYRPTSSLSLHFKITRMCLAQWNLKKKQDRRFLIICICNNIPIILNFSV